MLNPSTLQQRSGRATTAWADRPNGSACQTRCFCPIWPQTQGDKMFRVVGDRERWFQIIIGGNDEVDGAPRRTDSSAFTTSARRFDAHLHREFRQACPGSIVYSRRAKCAALRIAPAREPSLFLQVFVSSFVSRRSQSHVFSTVLRNLAASPEMLKTGRK